ncbi:hypothetical protein ASE04_28965 [Rhizobium sp. Root708]|uniref:hypothetical protein n=1 Tax=Rhizobium sp. Root708 TaxID=1736592 RepID=UPI0006F28001|nr:hypothetical protein [Rhizobium sp. Root708]KRB56186.1 hypothetical protein ASE04_28965 [Rhizobium sp. Root708]
MLPLKDEIADDLMDERARPFDAVLKSIFEKRHVLKRFIDAYVIGLPHPDMADQYEVGEDDGVEFLKRLIPFVQVLTTYSAHA